MSVLSPEQARGASPVANAWMSASAGTGKTQVLTARILRLLLSGAAPQAILAITFTKAGAAEMARRIRKDLASWVQMDDRQLSKALFEINAPDHADRDMLSYARTLFARVIDAPGQGLAIQTIHGFCQSLLAAFPEESGLAPGFQLADDREYAQLLHQILADALADLKTTQSDPAMLQRIERIAFDKGEQATEGYLYRCAGAFEALEALPDGIAPWLRRSFDLEGGISPDAWLLKACDASAAQIDVLAMIAAGNRAWGAATGLKQAIAIDAWIAADAARRSETLDDVTDALLTGKGELRASYRNPKQLGDVEDIAVRIAEWLTEIRATARHMAASDLLADALEMGRWYARLVDARKKSEGVVTYDDLIARTVRLLGDDGAAWIRYKLDMRVDHVLVDEAQDTNATQWSIVRGLTEEFFAGDGVKDDVVRTLFVVGDSKQAIYRFQGTSPIYFQLAAERFSQLGEAADRPFDHVGIDTNFRSSAPVLQLVDQLIANKGPEALGLDVDLVRHTAFADSAPGKVIIWPLEPPVVEAGDGDSAGESDEESADEGWIDTATRRVAGRIARTVRGWVADGLDGEAVSPGDVMVLVRKRADLAALIVSRLQGEGVPVAGIDRMQLGNPLAVRDLLSAMRFALQPQDDLNLACLLVSPLVGWTQDELAERGWRMDAEGRFPHSLWRHLNSNPALSATLQPLYDLLNMAGYANPHQFLETVLSGPIDGRSKLLARLGMASLDPIEELVSQALNWTTRHGPSLTHFLAWFDSGTQDIKREQDNAEDAVRVMTVHGSKGLQARIVILADAAGNPRGKRAAGFDWQVEGVSLPLLALPQADRPAALAAAMANEEDEEIKEHWRLLYVAATRAERVLCVAGALPKNGEAPDDNWYDALETAARDLGGSEESDVGDWSDALVYSRSGREIAQREKRAKISAPTQLPDWIAEAPPQEARPPKPLTPSAQEEQEELSVPLPPPVAGRSTAMLRGTLIHALFQRLPETPVAIRRDAALQWMAARGQGLAVEAQIAAVDAVLAILDDPQFAGIFGAQSLAEVPFSAVVGDRVIAGSVDRLRVSDDAIEVIDFKSGRMVPAGLADIPLGYVKQMAAYVGALEVIFPGRSVTASLLFSEGPALFTLPATLIEAHRPQAKPALSDG